MTVGGQDDRPVPWSVVGTAVALITRLRSCPDVPRSAVIGDCPPGQVTVALEAIASAMLAVLAPGEAGEFILEYFALQVADREAAEMAPPTPQEPAAASGCLRRCRWAGDGPGGRCPNPVAFPGVDDVPDLCTGHLAQLEPWVRSRAAAQQASSAPAWIAWAQRRAEAAGDVLRGLGGVRPDGTRLPPPPGSAA